MLVNFLENPEKKTDRKKETKSLRQNCPFEICLAVSEDDNALEVLRVNLEHKHEISKDLYESLPRQRLLPGHVLEEVKSGIKLKANNKLLQQKIEQDTGKKVTLKDISNIKYRTRLSLNRNDLDSVAEFLQKEGDSSVGIMVDEEKHFKGLLYQDTYMRNMFMKFPEVMLVDATYKLLHLRIPVYLLLVRDGNGLSEIIGLFLVEEESKAVISSIVNNFKEKDKAWSKTAVIMSDKDFTERESFSSCFHEAKLLIYLYHALRSFRREVTCEKMFISSAERNRVLEIIQSIAYANSEEAYKVNLKLLQNTKLHTVVDYFMENWDSIKEQWVMFYKDQSFNLGETTNNRIESTFRHVKNVCTKYASLMQVFSEFFSVLKTFRKQRNHNYLMALYRKSTKLEDLDSTLQQYHEYATPYAFAYIKR